MSGLLLSHGGRRCGHTYTRVRMCVPTLLNHFISLLSHEWRVTQSLGEATGTGTAKRLKTTQRHERKGKRKLFFNKMRSELDWREKWEFHQGGAYSLGVLLRCWQLSWMVVCTVVFLIDVYIHTCIFTCNAPHIYTYIHMYLLYEYFW